MKNILLLIIVQLFFNQAYAQKMFDVQFSNCPLKFILEDNEPFIEYAGNDSLMVVDFLLGMESKQAEKLMGTVMMQIMVDTANQICCVSYSNKTTMSSNKLDIPNRIIAMQGWKRMPNALASENICALVSIVFDKKEITVMRTGYNRNRGRNTIKSTNYKRILETKPSELENKEDEKK